MKFAKKILISIVCISLLVISFSITAFAGSVYPSTSNVTVAVGETAYVEIIADKIMGTYSVSCDGPIRVEGGGSIENDPWDGTYDNGYVNIYGTGIGSGVVTVSYNVATYDTEQELIDSFQIYVNVVENTYEGEAKTEPDDSKFDVTINDVKYTVVSDLSNITLPAGFKKADGTYGTEKVNVAKFVSKDNQEIVLYGLKQKEGTDIKFMTFNSSKVKFDEPKSLTQENITYYFLDIPASFKLPENYQVKEVTIGNYAVNAIVGENKEKSDFVYLYALANGEEGYYSYDTKEGTIQRCPNLEGRISPKVEIIKETEKSDNKTMYLIVGVAALAVLIMAIFLIILIVKRKKDKRIYEEGLEDIDYVEDIEDEDEVVAYNENEEYEEYEEYEEEVESDDLDDFDVIDLSDDKELEKIESFEADNQEEDDGLNLIDLTKKPKDLDK